MAEITKVTTPMIPRENMGNKNRPVTEQAFELNNPNKVNKPDQEKRIMDNDAGSLREFIGRAAAQPVLREVGDLMYNVQKMIALLQLGISTSDVMASPEVRELMQQIFTNPEELFAMLQQQDEAAVLFKGEAFDVLRDIVGRFEQYPRVRDAVVQLLKTFEYNVNTQNSLKSILYNCENLLDYMFSMDRQQFGSYLDGLALMLLPEEFAGEQPAPEQATAAQPVLDEAGNPVLDEAGNPVLEQSRPQGLDQKETAGVLKNNLLPLLGEIVVKYHQNGRIRDIVMVVVHNIVRVDKGSPEALRDAVRNLVTELKRVANLPENFERNLLQAVQQSAGEVKEARNEVMERLTGVISQVLHAPDESSPAALRQAENLLLSLLQNQSSLMDVMHFVLPMQTDDDRLFAELYVDPDSDEGRPRNGENSRKLFLTVNSENHGAMELCFLQYGERVEFSMWCPEILLKPLSGMRRTIQGLMQTHGYTMAGFRVEQYRAPQTVAQVFPKLLNRKVGIDVKV